MAAAVRNPPFGGTGAGALQVALVDERGRRLHVRGLAAWLRRAAPRSARGAVTVVLVSDPRMRALNRTYRGKDYATDVLSFSGETSLGRRGRIGGKGQIGRKGSKRTPKVGAHTGDFPIQPLPPDLGDIVIARGVARRQARAAGYSELDELRLLALHGLLHLLGYDHERDNGRMRRVERRLRRTGGLHEGLIERASE
jgi:probable rRNA maturation factor